MYSLKIVSSSSWALEVKVLLVLFYYVIMGAAVLTIFTHDLIVLDRDALERYFSCESAGHLAVSNTTMCSKEKQNIEHTTGPVLTAISTAFFGLLPAVNLVYVLKFRHLKRKIKTYSHTRYLQYIRRGAGRVGRYIPYLNNEHKTASLNRGSRSLTNTEALITPMSNYDSHY